MQPRCLTIGIVTRGRVELALKTATETLKNCTADTQIVILGDRDDGWRGVEVPRQIILDIHEREDSVAAKSNRLMRIAPADAYMHMVDYVPQITPGFDQKILDAAALFTDGIGCVYQRLANLSFPCYQTVTAEMAAVMGHFYVEYFPYWFIDHWLDDICRMTGRYVYAEGDVMFYPRPGNGKTQDFREPALWATLYDALYLEREAIAERLFAAMDIQEFQKAILRAQWPLVHQRSRMVNNIVRDMKGDAPHDERYERIRARGIAMLEKLYYELEKRAA